MTTAYTQLRWRVGAPPRRTRNLAPATLAAALACALASPLVQAQSEAPPTFDEKMLRQRGIDPELVKSLAASPHFPPGVHPLTVTVNGTNKGRADVQVDAEGRLCFDAEFLQRAGLELPGADETPGCQDFIETYPQTIVQMHPSDLRVDLIVPQEAVVASANAGSAYQHGGVAGLFNYSLSGVHSESSRASRTFWSANTEVGLNAGDWIVRSRQSHSYANGQARNTHLDSYVQRSFVGPRLVMQAGQINLDNPMLGGAQVTGAQLMTESALAASSSGAQVSGLARTQAQVEVFQDGVLVHSTLVPAGPFVIDNVRRLNSRSDLEVVVTEADGTQERFPVPAALSGDLDLTSGFTLGAGRLRNIGLSDVQAPWLVNAGWTGTVRRLGLVGIGGMLTSDYRAVGASTSLPAWANGQLRIDVAATDAPKLHDRGHQVRLSMSQRLGEVLTVNATASRQSRGYRELFDTVLETDDASLSNRISDQWGATVGWSLPAGWGRMSAGYTASRLHDGRSTRRGMASWGTQLGPASLSATAQWGLGGDLRRDNSVFVNLNLPLGPRRSVNASMRNSGGQQRVGLNYNDRTSDTLSYRVGAEHTLDTSRTDYNVGVNMLPRYTQADLAYTRYDSGSSSTLAGLRGGVVLHRHGVTLSPYPIQESFAVISAGTEAGLRIATPSGPVWTDAAGRAVAASLRPFGTSAIEVNTRSLPRNLDLVNGSESVNAARGFAGQVQFQLHQTRRLLLSVTDANGDALATGAPVVDDDGQFIGLVQEGSAVLVPNALTQSVLWVQTSDQQQCKLEYDLPARADPDAYYESLSASCSPHREPPR